MVPKLHYMAHCAIDLRRQADRSRWAMSPLACSVQLQEDFVGRPSRVSRRVNIRRVHRNVICRVMILGARALAQSDADARGMDAYRVLA